MGNPILISIREEKTTQISNYTPSQHQHESSVLHRRRSGCFNGQCHQT